MEIQKMKVGQVSTELLPSRRLTDHDALKETLKRQMLKVGIRGKNVPNDVEWQFLKAFVQKHYGLFDENQIDEAFDLAIIGQLGISDVSCYENFSCEYFGRIMAGYRQYLINTGRAQKNTDIERHRRQETKNELPAPPANWEPHIQEIKSRINSGDVPAIIPTAIYDYLEANDLLPKDSWRDFIDAAKTNIKSSLHQEKTEAMANGMSISQLLIDFENIESGGVNGKVIVQAKRLAIINHLQNT